MKHTTTRISLAAALVAVVVTPGAWAQIGGPGPMDAGPVTRGAAAQLLYEEGLGGYVAKVETTWVEDQLCVSLALAIEPRGLRPGNFNFVRFLEVDDTKRTSSLKIKFPKKPERGDDDIGVWATCIDAPPRLVNAEKDAVQITVRQFSEGGKRPTEVYMLDYPQMGTKTSISLSRAPDGQLYIGASAGG